jgi:hypothetical protein
LRTFLRACDDGVERCEQQRDRQPPKRGLHRLKSTALALDRQQAAGIMSPAAGNLRVTYQTPGRQC